MSGEKTMSFKKNKYVFVKKALSKELATFLYNYFLIKQKVYDVACKKKYISPFEKILGYYEKAEDQVPGSYANYADIAGDTLLLRMQDVVEQETNLKLYPNYSYQRTYKTGDDLKKHIDRFSCEISTTVFLGGDEWPIYMDLTGGLFYISSLNIWNNPGFNGVSNPDAPLFPMSKSQQVTPLSSNPGDFILQGRFGNSLRLGNTNSKYINTWSEVGENGDPIVIISNGQSANYTQPTEDIKENLSSIYLTSYQKIANFSLANENFNSYKNPPEKPAEYKQSQIILNSSRVILNANNVNDTNNDNLNTGDVLISGEKSIGLSSNKSINIESTETIIDGNILLGSKDAKE